MNRINRTEPRITAASPYREIQEFVASGETNSRVKGILEDGFQKSKSYLQEGMTHTFNAAKMIVGFLAVIGGAVAAAIFKENTAADWGSKILMILGAILGVAGVKDVIDHNKKIKDVEPEFSCKTISNGEEIKCTANNLQIADPDFFKKNDPSKPESKSKIRKNEHDIELRTKAAELLKKYTSPEIISIINSYDGGVEDAFTNIEDRNIPASELQDRIALLIGYVYGSRPDIETDSVLQTLLTSVLGNDYVPENYFKVLPQDFVKTYYSVKWFEHNQNSIQTLIDSSANSVTLNDLNKIQKAQNQLNVLQSILLYVLDPGNLKSASSAKNVHVLRQALICGFGLKGNNMTEFNRQLKDKFDNVKSQLETVTDHINKTILPKINDGTLSFLRKSDRIPDKVLGDISWSEFKDKPLQPASV